MNGQYTEHPPGPGITDQESLGEMWVCLAVTGASLMVLGAAAIGSSFIASLATMVVFGILLVLGAIFQVITAFWGRRWRGFVLHLLAGVLYLVTGVFLIDNPLKAALGLTLLVAACLLVGGLFRIVLSLAERFDGWGFMLLGGVVSVLLGVAVWRQWPLSGFKFIGLFVGVEMLFCGVSWLMLGLRVRPGRGEYSRPEEQVVTS